MLLASSRALVGVVLMAAALIAAAGDAAPTIRLLVQSSPLAGFRYYAAGVVWGDLKVGDPLELAREVDNPFDARATSVAWRGHKIGYVPRRENAAVAWGLDRGERLHARISRLLEHPNPARRIEFEIYIE